MHLSVRHHPDGVATDPGNRVAYDIDANAATFGAATIDGPALVWELGGDEPDALLSAEVALDGAIEWLMRCDRVDFPPAGVAHTHTHPGPGIRVLLHGGISIDAGGASRRFGPFEAWFESGPEPVFARVDDAAATAFVRVMLLPSEWEGRRTIRYVDPADADKPKTQKATVFCEHAVVLDAG